MKKITILCLLAFTVPFFATAQQKGDMYVGGMLGFSAGSSSLIATNGSNTQTDKQPTPFTFSIQPEYGYFLTDNFRIGAVLGLDINTQKNSTESRLTTTMFSIGPQLAYYVEISDGFYYTPELTLSLSLGRLKEKITSSTSSKQGLTGFIGSLDLAAFEVRATEQLAISISLLSLSYEYTGFNMKNTDAKIGYSSFNFALSASVGVRYYF